MKKSGTTGALLLTASASKLLVVSWFKLPIGLNSGTTLADGSSYGTSLLVTAFNEVSISSGSLSQVSGISVTLLGSATCAIVSCFSLGTILNNVLNFLIVFSTSGFVYNTTFLAWVSALPCLTK